MKTSHILRNLLVLLLALVCLGGLVYLWIAPSSTVDKRICQGVSISVQSEQGGEALFLSSDRILEELAQRGVRIKGKELDSIDLRHIEQTLLKLPI